MVRSNNLHIQISKLQKQISALQKKEADRRKAKKSKALTAIVKIAKDAGLTALEVSNHFQLMKKAKKERVGRPKKIN
jgi:DNA-binding protein H-NS